MSLETGDAPGERDRLITRDEARTILGGIGRTKLDELLLRGEIASAKIGRRRLVSRASLHEFIRARLGAQ
jgi:excisionase family DNA binding protein